MVYLEIFDAEEETEERKESVKKKKQNEKIIKNKIITDIKTHFKQ